MKIPFINIHIVKSDIVRRADALKKSQVLLKMQTDSINYLHSQIEEMQEKIDQHPQEIEAAVKKRETFIRDVTNKIMSGLLAENANLMLRLSNYTGQEWDVTQKSILTKKEKQWLRKIGA